MRETLQFAVLGLGVGAIYVLLAQGVVVIYRGSGIINFAHGALAMFAGQIFCDLRGTQGWPTAPAAGAAVLVAGLLAAATQFVVLRRLTTASPLTRTVATLGVFVTLQSAALVIWGPETVFTPPLLPQGRLVALDVGIGVDRLWMLGIAAVLTGALWAVGRYSTFGLATAAIAENEETVAAAGWSPNVLAATNFALGGMLAGLAGVLVAPVAGIQAGTTSLLVIPALAVALLGGFSSFAGTALAGLALGLAESIMANHVTMQGATKSLPFAVIVVVLMVRGRALPLRAYIFDRLPKLGAGILRPRIALAMFLAITGLVLFVFPIQWVEASIISFAWISVLLSVVVLTGYCGQLSLGQLALAGVAAWSAGRLVDGQGWPFELALVVGVITAGVVGLVFALPALRTRGANLGVVTMGLGLSLYLMVFTNPRFTGGTGGTRVEPISFLGVDVDPLLHPERYAVMTLALTAVCCLLVARLRHTDAGRDMVATRSNERAAAALGVSVLRTKMLAFGLSAMIAGVGGVLLAFRSRTISLGGFDPFSSILAVAYTVIGGVGAAAGALIGAVLIPTGILSVLTTELSDTFGDATEYLLLLGGVGLLVGIIQNPDGIAFARRRRHPAEPRSIDADEPIAPSSPPPTEAASAPSFRARPAVLEVESITVRFGAVEALSDVSLSVRTGSVTGFIGPNGAGKTTLIDAVTGFVRPATGEIRLDGTSITKWSPDRRARAGLSRSFQSLELFDDLTVRENLLCASQDHRTPHAVASILRPDRTGLTDAASVAVAAFDLAHDLERYPPDLPFGRRRLVAIARAFALSPSLLLLDEPAAGLGAGEVEELRDAVRTLVDEHGVGVLLVEHDVSFVMSLSDEVVVLDFGKVLMTGDPSEVRRSQTVIDAYLGTPVPSASTS